MENSKQPAFPLPDSYYLSVHEHGLTKREYFAGLAMQGLLANNSIALPSSLSDYEFRKLSNVCLKYADSLLKQLDNGN